MFTDVINGYSPGMLRAAMAMAGFEGGTGDIERICGVSCSTSAKRLYKGIGWRRDEILRLVAACRMSPTQVIGIWFNLPDEIQEEIDQNNDVIVFRPPKNPKPVPVPGTWPDVRIDVRRNKEGAAEKSKEEGVDRIREEMKDDRNQESIFGKWPGGQPRAKNKE